MCFRRLVKAERLGPGGYLDAGGCKEGLNIAMTAVSLSAGRGALALMLLSQPGQALDVTETRRREVCPGREVFRH